MTSSSLNVGNGFRQHKPTTNSEKKEKEYRMVFAALNEHKRPLTRRRLSEITGLEISNLCRCLYNLTYKRQLLEIAKYGICPTTGKTVMHYYFKAEKEVSNAF